jgi:hypothetical protein
MSSQHFRHRPSELWLGDNSLTAFSFDPEQAAVRIVAGRALVVGRATGRLHRLDRTGTEILRLLTAAAPAALDVETILRGLPGAAPGVAAPDAVSVALFLCDMELAGLLRGAGAPSAGSRDAGSVRGRSHAEIVGVARPRRHVLTGAWEVVDEIERSPGTIARRVGDGWLLRDPGGELWALGAEPAAIWTALSRAPHTFVELLDLLCERGLADDVARARLASILLSWHDRGAIRGLERVDRLHHRLGEAFGEVAGARSLGRLEATARIGPPPPPPRLGSAPTLRDPARAPGHVAIVCQYGIQDLAPGVEPYTQRCIARLRDFARAGAPVDLVILAGGGRHGRSELREAESVIDRYRALLPEPALLVEKHSATTWENLQWSLEMLDARGVVPRRISFLGDRARIEKLRVACWIARRRFVSMRDVSFRAVPIVRPRFTWRDNRAVQIVVGSAQIIKESRERLPAAPGAPA